YPSLCIPVLPWATQGRRFGLDPEVSNRLEDCVREDRVVIVDQESDRRLIRERFSKLLDYPRCGRVLGDVEVQDFAAAMGDHEPDEQHLEADRRYHQEIHPEITSRWFRSNVVHRCLCWSPPLRFGI